MQTLRSPFSAVSKPICASKYSCESSWRDLQDLSRFTYFGTFGIQLKKPWKLLHRSEFENFSWMSSFFRIFAISFSKCGWCFAIVDQNSAMLMKHFQNNDFRHFYGKYKNLLDYQISWDFATKILEFWKENGFRKVRKKLEVNC